MLAVFFWPLATRRAAYASMITGFLAGLFWYQLGGWSPASFFIGIHPVWVGMSVNVVVLIGVTLATARWRVPVDARKRSRGALVAAAWLTLVALVVVVNVWLTATGLLGLAIFILVALGATATFLLTEPAPSTDEQSTDESTSTAPSGRLRPPLAGHRSANALIDDLAGVHVEAASKSR